MTGDSIAGSTTFDTTPCHWTPESAAGGIAAQPTPPISACEELDGTPRYQVSRFHVMPPTSPANTTVRVTRSVLTNPLAIVAATLKDRKAPTRLSSPDSATATFGGSAPDAMEVAIALPVSWKPFVKSKARAVMTTSASSNSDDMPVPYPFALICAVESSHGCVWSTGVSLRNSPDSSPAAADQA